MNHHRYDDAYIRGILNSVTNVAIVGASPSDNRPSHFVVKYLARRGYRVFPVNPGHGGKTIANIPAYAKLADVPEPLDMVDVFRNSEHVPGVLDEVLKLPHRPKVFWMQLGVRNDGAAARAEAAGMQVVMNRCPKIEYGRLSGEIGWVGVNTRTLSAKKPQRMSGGVQRLTLGSDDKAGG
ncbi:MAG TPA: CoA-binding protein [Xanthobacteraceae bacterium]|nr:CoA-binding protein [Xanthobacteraceae bacterium]